MKIQRKSENETEFGVLSSGDTFRFAHHNSPYLMKIQIADYYYGVELDSGWVNMNIPATEKVIVIKLTAQES